MPPGRGGVEQGCGDARSHSNPSFPDIEVAFEMKKHEHAASLPHGRTEQDTSLSTGNGGHDEHAPPLPSTEEQEQHPMGCLPADALVEILSRVPYKSLCRFKCVSKPWLSLCSDPDVRKRCPQTLSGFFYTYRKRVKFHNLSGRGPPLVDPGIPFLRRAYDHFRIEQCCSGLLLCKYWNYCKEEGKYVYDYVVCNPMTGQWTAVPPIIMKDEGDHFLCFEPVKIILGFDPAVPSRFMVFVPLIDCYRRFTEIAIYSSETGQWTTVQTEWGHKTIMLDGSECVYLNGTMQFSIHYGLVLTVDVEGKVWREIEMPNHSVGRSYKFSIAQSEGHFYGCYIDNDHGCQLYVWVLEDYVSGKWTVKHTATVSELFGRQSGQDDRSYYVFAMHPDCNCIFITDKEEMAVSYDMDNQKVNVRCTFQEFKDVVPYVPCFAEWSSDGH